MAAGIETTCPSCAKVMKVPAEIVGKLIRCKSCSTTFEVIDPNAPKPVPKPAKPKAKPAAAKPKADADAPIKFAEDPPAPNATAKVSRPFDEEPDENSNPYGVTKDDLDIPRCPFCAIELDPPDTKICRECGYDLLQRKRHESKKVYETTAGDYFLHWLPAIGWIIGVMAIMGIAIAASFNMRSWLEQSFLAMDEKNPVTNRVEFYLPPFCFNIWIWIFALFFSYKGMRYIIKRLVYNWKPHEVVKKT